MKKLLFVVGMQKSGTSLLNRILMVQDHFCNPFLPEGKYFWGDNPPFNPVDKPCGTLFQRHRGMRGHALDASDFSISDQILLQKRIEDAEVNEAVLMNKNPYNTVRLPWLKKVFPEAKIVAIYRAPVPNVYSLLKKYHSSDTSAVQPDDGWWGIKPDNWQKYISENKISQCANQWIQVNEALLKNRKHVDLIIDYENLCEEPSKVLRNINDLMDLDGEIKAIPQLRDLNSEYLIGSTLESKNKELRHGNFTLEHLSQSSEFPALKPVEVQSILNLCSDLWKRISLQ